MTNPDYTHIMVVLDRSGSMSTIRTDMQGALNEFFKAQAQVPGTCLVDFVQFDDQYELVYTGRPVKMANAVLKPRGLTALVDAIGKSVTDLGVRLAALDEDQRPGKVIVAVITDGMENASREWEVENVKKLLNEQRDKYNWTFTFLGANMDAVKVGALYGFNPGDTLTYQTGNTSAAASSLSSYTTRSRLYGQASYTDEDRKTNA